MNGRKKVFARQKSLLRLYEAKSRDEPDRAGLSINDYDVLCKANARNDDRNTVFARKSHSLILK